MANALKKTCARRQKQIKMGGAKIAPLKIARRAAVKKRNIKQKELINGAGSLSMASIKALNFFHGQVRSFKHAQ